MATLFSVSWTYKYFMGSLLSIPLHRLEQISFLANLATFFCLFLELVNIFIGSLLSIPLHRLQLISFSATPGNKCCHGNTFFFFFLTYKYFYGFFVFHTPHRLELISFSATSGNKCYHGNTFLCFLGLKIVLGYLCIPNPCIDFS